MSGSQKQIMDKCKNGASKCANALIESSSKFISNSSGIKQFAFGGASGWCTGFLATKVGKTVAISVGGTIVALGAASEAGLVTINWGKLGDKAGSLVSKVENKLPEIKNNVGKYSKGGNTMFAAGFVGGFLLGLAS